MLQPLHILHMLLHLFSSSIIPCTPSQSSSHYVRARVHTHTHTHTWLQWQPIHTTNPLDWLAYDREAGGKYNSRKKRWSLKHHDPPLSIQHLSPVAILTDMTDQPYSQPLHPQGKNLWNSMDRELDRTQRHSGHDIKQQNFLLCQKLISCSPSHFTNSTNPTKWK